MKTSTYSMLLHRLLSLDPAAASGVRLDDNGHEQPIRKFKVGRFSERHLTECLIQHTIAVCSVCREEVPPSKSVARVVSNIIEIHQNYLR